SKKIICEQSHYELGKVTSLSRLAINLNQLSHHSAQCSPRHACPLKGPLLMQVQRWPQAAPRLALAVSTEAGKRMQSHAPFGCMA
ncbi:hypothetical protein EOX65_18540, partial [Salmonella enterica]|nr:hypothetical protein [Salmonella enterica]